MVFGLTGEQIGIQIGNNSFVYAEGVENVKALVKWQPRTLQDTLYVPKLKKNLFSVGAAANKNLKIPFDNNKIEVCIDTGLVASGVKSENQCYKMLLSMERNQQTNYASSESVLLWHQRLGHVSFETLKKIADSGLIPLKLSNADQFFCESCQYGKLRM